MTADRAMIAAIADLSAALRDLGEPAMVIGGMAVLARGIVRQTVDVDATIWSEHLDLDHLFAVLARHGIAARIPDARKFAAERQVLLLKHEPTSTPLEISLASLPFERDALNRATVMDFGGASVPVATAEDLIIYKAIAWRDRDRSDIERLLVRYRDVIDLDRVRTLVQQFAAALDEPERVPAFDALVRRALTS